MGRSNPTPQNLPIVIPRSSGGWCETVPAYLRNAIIEQRELQLADGTFKDYATDAEVLVVLYCLSLTAPLLSEYVDIYMYVLTKVFEFLGIQVPEELRKEELSPDLQRELLHLKREIRRKTLAKRRR